jgi:phage-related protein
MKKWLNGKEIKDLWFAEAPHKVYSAKVTGTSQMTSLAFAEDGKRVYKGKGTIQFTCYNPYAHTPDVIRVIDEQGLTTDLSGRCHSSYLSFGERLYNEIKSVLPLATNGDG